MNKISAEAAAARSDEIPQGAAETSVEAHNISKVYWDGDRRLEILKNVSLSVQKGEGVAILGPSGTGKTTLLNILAGLDRPNEGTVRLSGTDLSALDDNARSHFRNRHLGFVFQFYHLLPEFTAIENVMLPALIAGSAFSEAKAREKAFALLEKTGLKQRSAHFPSELSGGEQQRLAIARALMNDPDILFCDEPTGNLDRQTGTQIAEMLKRFFTEEKKTVVMVTHDLHVARLATKIWNIVKGDWE